MSVDKSVDRDLTEAAQDLVSWYSGYTAAGPAHDLPLSLRKYIEALGEAIPEEAWHACTGVGCMRRNGS